MASLTAPSGLDYSLPDLVTSAHAFLPTACKAHPSVKYRIRWDFPWRTAARPRPLLDCSRLVFQGPQFFKTVDTILWGRKTYAKGIEMGMKGGGLGAEIKNYLFSRRPQESLETGFEWINEPIKTFAQRLRAQSGRDIWMMGGGGIIASFLDEGEID